MFNPDILMGQQPVQLPDPMASATRAMTLANLSDTTAIRNLAIQQSQRQQDAIDAANRVLPMVQQGNWSPEVMQAAIQQEPQSASLLLDMLDKKQSAESLSGKNRAEGNKFQSEASTTLLKPLTNQAFELANDPRTTPDDIRKLMGNIASNNLQNLVPNIDFKDWTDPTTGQITPTARAGLKTIGSSFFTADQQLTTKETARHNVADEAAKQQELAQQAWMNRATIGQQNLGHAITAAQTDPFNMMGMNPWAGGSLSIPKPGQAGGAFMQPGNGSMAATGVPQPSGGVPAGGDVRDALAARGGQQPAPQGQQQPQPQMSIAQAMQSGVTGADFLKLLPPPIASQVKQIADGDVNINILGQRAPYMKQAMVSMVLQYDPTWTEASYGIRNSMRKEVATGSVADNIKRIDTATLHLGNLVGAFDQMNNSGTLPGIINPIENAITSQYDPKIQDARQTIQTSARGIAGELAAVFRRQGMAEADINNWLQGISDNMSPAAQKASVRTAINMMQDRKQPILNQWQSVFPNRPFPVKEEPIVGDVMGAVGDWLNGKPYQDPASVQRINLPPGPNAAASNQRSAPAQPQMVKMDKMPDPSTLPDGVIVINDTTGLPVTVKNGRYTQ